MSKDEGLLARLRAVFRGELEDHLSTVERACVLLARQDAGPAQQRHAVQEIFRAAHSLKGAARAVGYARVESLCHGLESALAPVRAGTAPIDAEAVRAATEAVAASLEEWTRRHLDPAPEQDSAPPAGPVVESIRVSTARIAELLSMGEGLLSSLSSAAQDATTFSALEDSVDELRRHLSNLRRSVRLLPEVHERTVAMAAVNGALMAAQTVSAWTFHQRRARTALWSSAVRRGQRLVTAARRLRVVAFQTLHPLLERTALEAARTLDKQVALALRGGEAEIDRQVLERLRDPLSHLIHNAVDHGIEPPDERVARGKPAAGSVLISVRTAGEEVTVTVEDDGAGLDLATVRAGARERGMDMAPEAGDGELLSLLFEPGFTTRGTATAISGRGMGLDVVRQRIAEMQGRIAVHTAAGRGMRVELTVPLDLSAMSALILEARGTLFALAETAVVRLVRATASRIQRVEGREYLRMEGTLVPLADLCEVLGLADGCRRCPDGGHRLCVVIAAGERRVAFVVDALHPPRAVVIKPLGQRVRRAAFVAGASVLSGGAVAPVLDTLALVSHARPVAVAPEGGRPTRPPARILVVDDSVTTRQLLRSLLEAAGYQVDVAPDGQSAWSTLVRDPVDLVVSDIEMPRMDGFQLLARVRATAHTVRIPFVLVTAMSRDIDRQRALDLGANAYVVKSSFDQEALLETIEELLE